MMPDYLNSTCSDVCRNPKCAQAVKQAPNGRWFITIGHAGFNTAANNGNGYGTEKAARKAVALLTGMDGRVRLAERLESIAGILRGESSQEPLEQAAWRLADAGALLTDLLLVERNGNSLHDVQGIGHATGRGAKISVDGVR